jgi:hypothetical protein
MVKEQVNNMDFFKALRDFGQEAGMSTPDKDETIRLEKEAIKEGARIDKQDSADIRESRFLRGRKDEDLF